MMRLLPLTSRARRALRGQCHPFTVADDCIEFAPATTMERLPALHLPDEMDRILGLADDMPIAEFVERTAGGAVRQPPTLGYRYDRAVLADGCVYVHGALAVVGRSSKHPVLRGKPEHLLRAMLVSDPACDQYFGHWLTDGLSMELLAKARELTPVVPTAPDRTQEPAYRRLAGIQAKSVDFAQIDDFWMVDDRSINRNRSDRMAALRRRMRGDDRPAASSSGMVFLRRVGGAARRLANQDELGDALAARGFTVLTPETTPVEELTAALRNASVVVSVEGSALCHAVVNMADHGTIVAIQPPHRVNWIQKVWCDAADLRMAYTIADPLPDGSFTLDLDRLLAVLDLVNGANDCNLVNR